MSKSSEIIEALGVRYHRGSDALGDAGVAQLVAGMPPIALLTQLLDLAAMADRSSPTAAPATWRDDQHALIEYMFRDPLATQLHDLLEQSPLGIAFTSRAALHLSLVVLDHSGAEAAKQKVDLDAIGRALMHIDHRWSIEEASQAPSLRAFQTYLFHGTGQHKWNEETAFELFIDFLPRRAAPAKADVDFPDFDNLVRQAFGFGIADSIALAHLFGDLAYEKRRLLTVDRANLSMMCGGELWRIAQRHYECSRWLDHYSIDLQDASTAAHEDLSVGSGFAFSAFYDRPFIKTSSNRLLVSRIDWVQRLGSAEAVYTLCRDAMAWHLQRLHDDTPDEHAERMEAASLLWRDHYGHLIQDYVASLFRRCPRATVWEERDVPGLESTTGAHCDVVVESELAVLLAEVKAAVPGFREATRLDVPFMPYLKRISVGNAKTKTLRKQRSPFVQLETTMEHMTCGVGKPRIGLVVTGSKVTLTRGHLEDMNGLWRQRYRPDGSEPTLMVDVPAAPLDLAGVYLLTELAARRHLDIGLVVHDWYMRAVNSAQTLSAIDFVKGEDAPELLDTPARNEIEAIMSTYGVMTRRVRTQ